MAPEKVQPPEDMHSFAIPVAAPEYDSEEFDLTSLSDISDSEEEPDNQVLPLYNYTGELKMEPMSEPPWQPVVPPCTPYELAFRKYKGQPYLQCLVATQQLTDWGQMALMKHLPAFSQLYDDMLEHFDNERPGPEVLTEACEGLYCLLERPATGIIIMSDQFWEDLQTFAHLTCIVDLYFTWLCKVRHTGPIHGEEVYTDNCEHMQALKQCLAGRSDYLYLKHYMNLEEIIRSCRVTKLSSVATAIGNVEIIKQLMLRTLLYNYDQPGPALVNALLNKQSTLLCNPLALQYCELSVEDVEADVNAQTNAFILSVDHRRSFRTRCLRYLPLANIATDNYVQILNRQLAVGVVPLFNFATDTFRCVDERFFALRLTGQRTEVMQSLWQMPDPIAKVDSFERGLISETSVFSRHTAYTRLPLAEPRKTNCVIPPMCGDVKKIYYMCAQSCEPDKPACHRCMDLLFRDPVTAIPTPELVEKTYHAFTFDLPPFPPRVHHDIVSVAKQMPNFSTALTVVGQMVRFYLEIKYQGVKMERNDVRVFAGKPSRYDLFKAV